MVFNAIYMAYKNTKMASQMENSTVKPLIKISNYLTFVPIILLILRCDINYIYSGNLFLGSLFFKVIIIRSLPYLRKKRNLISTPQQIRFSQRYIKANRVTFMCIIYTSHPKKLYGYET